MAAAAKYRSRLAIAAAATLAAGCGGTLRVGTGRTLLVALSEYRINPSSASVSPGTLTLVVHNYGRLTHNLVIAYDGQPQDATPALPPGAEATLVVELARGRYTMSSTILSDADLGERGTLTVG